MSGANLVGRIVAARVEELIARERGARVMFAVIDLSKEVTSAIATAVGAIRPTNGRVQVGIHPDLATADIDPSLVSSDVAVKFRNNKPADVVATVFSVPISEMELVIQSLGSVERINESWLLEGKEFKRWAEMGLTNADPSTKEHLHGFLRGLLASEVRISIETLADFVAEVDKSMAGQQGLGLVNAINAALPILHLPRECLEASSPEALAKTAEAQLRRAADIVRLHFHLQGSKGDYRPSTELLAQVDSLTNGGSLDQDAAEALKALIADRLMFGGRWTPSQARIARIPWKKLRSFFEEPKAKVRPNLGRETLSFLKEKVDKGSIGEDDVATLDDIRSEAAGSTTRREAFFLKWRPHLSRDAKLYKRWERLVFNAPIEADDLMVGLVLLAAHAFRQVDDEEGEGQAGDKVVLIRLRGAFDLDFWIDKKNTNLCRYLRDRYRGLDKLLEPTVSLQFGQCWSDWEDRLQSDHVNHRGSKAAEFDFEAFVVPAPLVAGGRNPADDELKGMPKAQMTWKPAHRGLHIGFSDDLAALLSAEPSPVHLLSSWVKQARHSKSGSLQAIDLGQVETLTDARGTNRGILTDPDEAEKRIERLWHANLDRLEEQDIIKPASAATLRAAFAEFHGLYDRAIRGFREVRGQGVANDALVAQAEAYGRLLVELQRLAIEERSIGELWDPLLRIGTSPVDGERKALIVAPWHPLRLAEIGAKAKQAAETIAKVVSSPEHAAPGVEDFVSDRVRALSSPYYVDIGVLPGAPRTFVAEMSRLGEYGLLEPPSIEGRDQLADEPARETVKAFGAIARQYLDLRPHEAANFSAVILDAESEDLPVLMASHLARQIEGEADLRCDLTVTHADPVKLRAIYERQNRRIGHEIDSSLTSEAARTFLSRLRVGISSLAHFQGGGSVRQSDIVLLHNVIARHATVSWALVPPPAREVAFVEHRPCDLSRRRPYNKGNVRAGVYLTAPVQPAACRAYIDAVHDVLQGRAYKVGMHHLPMQEVDFASPAVQAQLKQAHGLGNWVMTYDRLADRRLISATDNLRVLRYFSLPRATHNVIVSTEISRESFRERLRSDIQRILPGSADEALDAMIDCVRRRSASLSGGIVMRGAQWENYAKELIGVVVAQRQLELLFDEAGPSKTAWFFLDEFKSWLDLSGEIADILAVNLVEGDGGPRIRLAIVEAKCVGSFGLGDTQSRSMRQLEATYQALHNRFIDDKATVDPGIWRNRLADMLLEHIDPFERVEEVAFDGWIEGLRTGALPIELSGHSVVIVHDTTAAADIGPTMPDEAKERSDRRRLAQWTFGEDVIKRTLSEIDDAEAKGYLREPSLWPSASGASAEGSAAAPAAPAAAVVAPPPATAPEDVPITGKEPAGQTPAGEEAMDDAPADGWLPEVHAAVLRMRKDLGDADDASWLDDEVAKLKRSIQAQGFDAKVLEARLTPNAGLIHLDGKGVTFKWLEGNLELLSTKYELDIIRVTPKVGRIAVAIRRPRRATLHLAEAWLRRRLGPDAPRSNLSPVVGEREEDGSLFYLPLAGPFAEQKRAAPHTIVSGATGSGKGILASSLILDICAFNAPGLVDLHLIDPKQGVDYAWVRRLPHLKRGIVVTKEAALELLRELVSEMEHRYGRLQAAECSNIDQYNRGNRPTGPMPRVIVFFDEVPNWMQDEEFKDEAEPILNEIATKSRAAGIHLTMIYQRADNQVMTMQLRTNLGNKLVLKLNDEGSSKIVLNEKGAEKLLGEGHIIGVMDGGDKIFGQVPFLDLDEVRDLACAIQEGWANWSKGGAREAAE
ncbi:FtsK/SpoIIIE domain-containing protein [Methylobacterium indicum]|uniref:FtsK/SpoIIIE domain-containing protein n=1 Tax=Methylobacterium indicum TaxID=1775910 RepID=UPI002435A9B3|nr:FtsK/SpoIIIE domain-containing protein [Methylobacterium indicum]